MTPLLASMGHDCDPMPSPHPPLYLRKPYNGQVATPGEQKCVVCPCVRHTAGIPQHTTAKYPPVGNLTDRQTRTHAHKVHTNTQHNDPFII